MPAYIFKALIGFASKVAPPAALPLSCCTATSVSGRVSLGGGAVVAGPAASPQPNWGPRTPPSAAAAAPLLADGRFKSPGPARGQRWAGGCAAPPGQRTGLL